MGQLSFADDIKHLPQCVLLHPKWTVVGWSFQGTNTILLFELGTCDLRCLKEFFPVSFLAHGFFRTRTVG